jgi:hypothetical protein
VVSAAQLVARQAAWPGRGVVSAGRLAARLAVLAARQARPGRQVVAAERPAPVARAAVLAEPPDGRNQHEAAFPDRLLRPRSERRAQRAS